MIFFVEIVKSIIKFIWKPKRLQIVKTILAQNSNTGHIIIVDFKLYKNSMALAQKQT
jgi:hypothetical protein